jgi:hypothetical protein
MNWRYINITHINPMEDIYTHFTNLYNLDDTTDTENLMSYLDQDDEVRTCTPVPHRNKLFPLKVMKNILHKRGKNERKTEHEKD